MTDPVGLFVVARSESDEAISFLMIATRSPGKGKAFGGFSKLMKGRLKREEEAW